MIYLYFQYNKEVFIKNKKNNSIHYILIKKLIIIISV